MNNRQMRLMWSGLKAYFDEHDRYMDLFHKERPFLENPNLPPVITLLPETKESEFKLERLKKNLKDITPKEEAKQVVGIQNDIWATEEEIW